MDGDNGDNGNGNGTAQPAPPTEPIISPFDWRIWILGIYLLAMLAASSYWLSGLMLADTTEVSKNSDTLSICRQNANTNTNVSNTAVNGSNTASNSNVDANTNPVNVNANTGNVNANTNVNTNTKVNANATPAKTAVNATPDNTAVGNASNKPANANTATQDIQPTVPKIVKVDGFGLFIKDGCLTGDGYVFLIVLFAGIVGAAIRGIFSFFWHLGRKDFSFSWLWFYLLLPFFGGTLSLILYFVIRGGFYSGSVGKALALNVFSFAALGALTGLFSDQAMAKLKLVAESLLTKTESKTNKPATNGKNDGG